MAKKEKKKSDKQISKDDNFKLELTRITEHQRTLRYLILTVGAVVAIYCITDAIAKIANKPEPAWLTLCLAILGAIGLGSSPMWLAWKWVGKFIKKRTKRIAELEKKADPKRSSSDLLEDGSLADD